MYNSKTLSEVEHLLKDAKYFSVFDTNKAFFHVPLSDKSKLLTAMLTPVGIYVYNCLAMGLCISTDVFESIISDLFQLDGVTNIADDFLVYGQTQEEHDRNVLAFLHRCVEVDMHLNPDKIQLNASEVPFFGNVLTKNGIKLAQSKVKVIKDWPTQTNVKELQSFLGMVNYLSRFIPNLSRLRAQLQELTRKDTPFVWTSVHDKAFHSLKCAISNNCLLQFYNPDADLYIEVDSSLSGTGYSMLQEYSEVMENPVQGEREMPQNLRPVAYGSKSFSSAET